MSVGSALIAFFSAMVGYFFSHYLKTRNDARKEFKEAVKLAYQALERQHDFMFDFASHKSCEDVPAPTSPPMSELLILMTIYFPDLDEAAGRLYLAQNEFITWLHNPKRNQEEMDKRLMAFKDATRVFGKALQEEARRQLSKSWWRREFGL
jgi:hypothetical protein